MSEQDTGSQEPAHSEDATKSDAQALAVATARKTHLIVDVVRTSLDVVAKNFATFFVVSLIVALPGVALVEATRPVVVEAGFAVPYGRPLSPTAMMGVALMFVGRVLTVSSFPLALALLSPVTLAQLSGTVFGTRKVLRQAGQILRAVLGAAIGWLVLISFGIAIEHLATMPSLGIVAWPLHAIAWALLLALVPFTMLSIPTIVLDRLSLGKALSSSLSLFQSHRLTVLLAALLASALISVWQWIPSHRIAEMLSNETAQQIVAAVDSWLGQAIKLVFVSVLASTLYIKIRSLRDGIDVAEIAQDFR